MAAATAEEREARLEGLRAAQQERLAAETAEERGPDWRDREQISRNQIMISMDRGVNSSGRQLSY